MPETKTDCRATRSADGHITLIPNAVLDDARISYGAKGFMCDLLSRRGSDDDRLASLLAEHPYQPERDEALALARELQEHGYLDLTTVFGEG